MKANSTANITLGRFVQNHRERLGISLRELARRIKTSPALVSWIELDRGFPSKTVANNLAKALGVAAEEILKFDDRISAVRLRRTIERNPRLRKAAHQMVREIEAGNCTADGFADAILAAATRSRKPRD